MNYPNYNIDCKAEKLSAKQSKNPSYVVKPKTLKARTLKETKAFEFPSFEDWKKSQSQ